MTASQVLERGEMPALDDQDPFCHLYQDGSAHSLCGFSHDGLNKPHGFWRPGVTVCTCGKQVCPDCIQAAP